MFIRTKLLDGVLQTLSALYTTFAVNITTF